ncbi:MULTISPECIES: glutamate ABC transporter substrate-binding protein [Rathayibacter]|jgi:glutamate transport system substrate-binding protein|uniref:ABC transporter substrate-binding protein n=1 Tax=Rathayibacter caricis DSM 15933 TaxID=1328867 RepID=A0A2T4UXB0_9MICO|nr:MULTISPECIES: glutamate ABC transporter substrate-binding protein [Rathayibacter]KQQ07793.1 ABC transporter substrate-binding protein [Rathayibacter sp. Leaf296]KQQ19164.1 ABC transporter substrate-binding protein [Rathayibacter sp. Leaf299]MCJ1695994.1 glutamate ABC transporter substrate-binding protein [Rathayibacter caricis]PTL74177.1 ABC transporter substrate-binding protein [Rathayibacter caricis DSM 15933]
MRTKLMFMTAGIAAATLALAGCAGGDSGTGDAGAGSEESGAAYEVATDVTLEGSPTFDAMTSADQVTIGVKEDQPGLGYLDAATGERSGFDIEIAKWIAASLGFSEDQIEYTAIPSANREASIVNGDIDYYVGTYSITDKRKEQVGFAGPYFETGQQLLVAADNDSIEGPDDLTAETTVCSATGSTPIQNIRTNYPDVPTEEFDTYSQCVDALNDGQVDAVTTDGAILIGYAAQNPDELKVVGEPFSTELYGVGLAKDDTALRGFINDMFTEGGDTWTAIYDETLGESGTEVEQPAVDAY